jgi:hypothetical protein
VPGLACWSCGREIYTSVPLASLFGDERRCPRCGATLHDERREVERRLIRRRANPADEPGPPASKVRPSAIMSAKPKATAKPESKPTAKAKAGTDPTTEASGDEQRIADRRTGQRRRGGSSRSTAAGDSSGWHD